MSKTISNIFEADLVGIVQCFSQNKGSGTLSLQLQETINILVIDCDKSLHIDKECRHNRHKDKRYALSKQKGLKISIPPNNSQMTTPMIISFRKGKEAYCVSIIPSNNSRLLSKKYNCDLGLLGLGLGTISDQQMISNCLITTNGIQ